MTILIRFVWKWSSGFSDPYIVKSIGATEVYNKYQNWPEFLINESQIKCNFSSTAIQDEAIRRRDFLMSSLEEMTSSASKEKEEKCSELEDALKEFKKFERRLQHQIADAKESNKNLVDAATIAQNSDPSGQWRLMRWSENWSSSTGKINPMLR